MNEVSELYGACFKFALAVVLSGILGLERQRKGRGAGLRTHILVCLGCTLMMVVSGVLLPRSTGGAGWIDTGRIAAGILTGIGFLGAGTIIRNGAESRGLTTAAMVWFVAGLGITIGAGLYWIAGVATAFALVVAVGLGYFERLLPMGEHVCVTVVAQGGLETLDKFVQNIRHEGFRVTASRIEFVKPHQVEMRFDLGAPGSSRVDAVAKKLYKCFPHAERVTFEG